MVPRLLTVTPTPARPALPPSRPRGRSALDTTCSIPHVPHVHASPSSPRARYRAPLAPRRLLSAPSPPPASAARPHPCRPSGGWRRPASDRCSCPRCCAVRRSVSLVATLSDGLLRLQWLQRNARRRRRRCCSPRRGVGHPPCARCGAVPAALVDASSASGSARSQTCENCRGRW